MTATPGPYTAVTRPPLAGETHDHPIAAGRIHIVVGAGEHTVAIVPDCDQHPGRAAEDAAAIADALNAMTAGGIR